MPTENTIRYRNEARTYSKRARILWDGSSNPSSGATVTDSHNELFTVPADGSLRRVAPKTPSRRDKIRAFGKYMGRQ